MRFNQMVVIQCIFISMCHLVMVCLGGYFLIFPKTNFKSVYFSLIMLTVNTFSYGSHGLNILVYLVFNTKFRQKSAFLMGFSNF